MRPPCTWRPQKVGNHGQAGRASMELSRAAGAQLTPTSVSASLLLSEGKSRTFIALSCILGTVMSAPGAHLAVDLEGSAWSAKVHLPSLWRRGGKCPFLEPQESGSSCAWSKHTVLIW